MNRIGISFFIALALSAAISCNKTGTTDAQEVSSDIVSNPATASKTKRNRNVPAIKFEHQLYDFGKIIQGEKVTHTYRFKNTGKAELIISDVGSSCGCTVPTWPRKAIAPGDESEINVVFDSYNKKGWQTKKISVVTNTTPNLTELNLVGEVLVPGE